MITWVRTIEPKFAQFQEAAIFSVAGDVVGWHATAVSFDGRALGSGCHSDRDTARRIALAEMLERAVFGSLLSSQQSHRLLLEEFPSTSGFAAGFDSQATRRRAICEAHERWAWSKWVDDGYALTELRVLPKFSEFARSLLAVFEEVRLWTGEFLAADSTGLDGKTLKFGVLLGFKEGGVFPGSRVALSQDDIWDHAAVEAWRHFHLTRVRSEPPKDIIQERAHYFAHNAQYALSAIAKSTPRAWPTPKMRLIAEVQLETDRFSLWRALCSDFTPWHLGSDRRFVY